MVGCNEVAHLSMLMGRDQVFASGTVCTRNIMDAAEKEDFNRVFSYNSVNAMGLFMSEQMFRLFTKGTGISMVCIPPAVLSDGRIVSTRRAHAEQPEAA